MLSFYGIKEMGAREWFEQLPLFAAVSIGSGLLGALFNALHKALLSVRPLHLVHLGGPPSYTAHIASKVTCT